MEYFKKIILRSRYISDSLNKGVFKTVKKLSTGYREAMLLKYLKMPNVLHISYKKYGIIISITNAYNKCI